MTGEQAMAHRILVVDDDPHIREVICFALEKADMQAIVAKDGSDALAVFAAQNPDLIVLDIGMPEMDGLEVCRQLRKTSNIPILFLSARDEEIDRILGLEIGGDDYVTKPFSPRELVARVNVILKRANLSPKENSVAEVLSHGLLIIDTQRHQAHFNSDLLSLTSIEFSILRAFLKRPGFIFTREQIMNAAYEVTTHVSDRTIDSHIRNIRAKLARHNCSNALDTVHGVGFRLGSCETD